MRQASAPAIAAIQWEPGAANVRLGRRAMPLSDLLRSDGDPPAPTALFVSNDIGAIAMMEACEAAGVRIPGGLSIVGFDDIAIASLGRISLTTVAQPLEFQAETAVHLLLDRIAQPRLRPRHVSVPVELRVRSSTAPPKAASAGHRRPSRSRG
jgi:DNA-binding LacI/PurR family transcriptional regulator